MDYFDERDAICEYRHEYQLDPAKANSEMQQFYADKTIFITGASGFLGSLIVESLLRKCPKIKQIYILLRAKRGKSMEERLEILLQSDQFNQIRQIYNNPLKKLRAISGDCSLPYCGMSEEDINDILENVDIVFHTAAVLRMDEHVRTAYATNVRATQQLLELGLKMKKLKAFVYVSTAYSTTFRPDISETFYGTTYSADELKTFLDYVTDKEAGAIMPKLIGPWGNSYAFTKAICEKLVESYSTRIPAVVARPSIVTASEKEPLVSWINNVYGATGVFTAACVGLVRVWLATEDKLADIIPADKVTSALLAVGWYRGHNAVNSKPVDIPVYNIVSSTKSPQTWKAIMDQTENYVKTYRLAASKFIRSYRLQLENRSWVFYFKAIYYHLLFGLIVDLVLKIIGKKPMLVSGYNRIQNFNKVLGFYSTSEWVYRQNNLDCVWKEMSDLDKKLFNFDMTNFDWKTYHSYSIKGVYKYIIKNDFKKLRRSRWLYFIYLRSMFFVKFVLYSWLFNWLLTNYISSYYRYIYNIVGDFYNDVL